MTRKSIYPAIKLLTITNWAHYIPKTFLPRMGTVIIAIQKRPTTHSDFRIHPITEANPTTDTLYHATLQIAMLHYSKLD